MKLLRKSEAEEQKKKDEEKRLAYIAELNSQINSKIETLNGLNSKIRQAEEKMTRTPL